MRIILPADQRQAMADIRLHLARQHRFEMVRRDHALAELLQLRRRKQIAEFRLAEQKYLEQRLPAELEIAQHP